MHRNGVIWRERNAQIFEGNERVTQELKMSFFQSLLGWRVTQELKMPFFQSLLGWINASGVSFLTSLTDLLNRCSFTLFSSVCSPDYLITCPVCFGF